MHSYKQQNKLADTIKISEKQAKQSLKSFLSSRNLSKSFIKRIQGTSQLLLNGEVASGRQWLVAGDEVIINYADTQNSRLKLSKKPLEIIFEDAYIIVIHKQSNLLTLPMQGREDSVASRLAAYYEQMDIFSMIHIMTRLDYGTEGLILAAKTGYIQNLLSQQIIDKNYFALVEGNVPFKHKMINEPIAKDEKNHPQRMVHKDGKASKTEIFLIKNIGKNSLISLKLHTGRTHQIRVHLKHLGYPLVGDQLYNKKDQSCSLEEVQLALLCSHLEFVHPITCEKMSFSIKKFPQWYHL